MTNADIFKTGDIETLYKAEPPLMPNNNGNGFMGVILHNKNTGKVRCDVCTNWFGALPAHINKAHQINADQYRKMFSLKKRVALCGRKLSEAKSDSWAQIWDSPKRKEILLKNMALGRKKFTEDKRFALKRNKEMVNGFKSLQHKNEHALCPEQIKSRYYIVWNQCGGPPRDKDLKMFDPSLRMGIYRHFGTLNKYRKTIGVPEVARSEQKYSDEQIIAGLRNFYIKNHRVPKRRELRNPDSTTIIDRFGSLTKAFNIANLI